MSVSYNAKVFSNFTVFPSNRCKNVNIIYINQVQLNNDSSRTFALKVMKKAQIVETRQQQHILSEKIIMEESNCDFIVK